MFWRVSGLNTASPVDSILDKDNFTLEELLDEDELIQECKSLNARLNNYLKEKATVERLLRYLVEPPPPGTDDPKPRFKYPFAACEIFCCEVEGIFNTLLENDDLLALLFSILKAERPLNCMLAGYFSRVMGSLLLRRTQDIMEYLQRQRELLDLMAEHVDTTSIAEVLVRLVGADDQRAFMPNAHMQWLAETRLLYLLLDKLEPAAPLDAQANAAEILAAIAQSQGSPLTRGLTSPEFLEQLCARALAPNPTGATTHALNVCVALLEPLPQLPQGGGMGPGSAGDVTLLGAERLAAGGGMQPDPAVLEVHEMLRAEAIQCMSRSIDALVALIEAPPTELKELPTTYGLLAPPVGAARLKAVELLAALLRTGEPTAEAAIMGTRGIQLSMDLLLAAPFNNVLHRQVAQLVTAFEVCSGELTKFLLDDCRLLDWMVGAPQEVTPPARPGNEVAPGEHRALRAGYCGHLTQVANRLVRAAGEGGNPALGEAMRGHEGWQRFLSEVLEPRNALESVFSWQCGRPSMHEPAMEGEMFQTELDFGSMDNEAFSRDVYQRYGAYENEDEEAEAETPAWALELAAAAGGSAAAAGTGKLMQPAGGVPTNWDSSDDESSSGSEGEGDGVEGELGRRVRSSSSEGESSAGLVVAPAPGPDGSDIVIVGASDAAVGGNLGPAASLGTTSVASSTLGDSDMMDDAVMLDSEFEAAEQLMELQQQLEGGLRLDDEAAAGSDGGTEDAAGGSAGTEQSAAAGGANGTAHQREAPAAAAEAAEGKSSEEAPAEFSSNNFWRRPQLAVSDPQLE